MEEMKSQQAALEQAARALRHELTQQDTHWDCCLSNEPASVAIIVKALAAQRAAVLEEALNRGEVWSFMRRVLSQGGDIRLDYQAGKYKGYEEYSARLDAAARERADQFIKEAQE